jgi:hypothetical protein
MSENAETSQSDDRVLNIKDLIKALMAIQVAIAKLVVALIEKESEVGAIPAPKTGGMVVDENCGPEQAAVDENCGPEQAAVDENCGPLYLDEQCDSEAPVPPICDEATLEQLCERVEQISRYLRMICGIVR